MVLHLYQDFLKTCTLLNKHLKYIADKYPSTKFCSSISTKTIPKFPDNRLPTLLLFKDGKLVHNINQVDKQVKLTQTKLEKFFAGYGMIDYDFPDSEDEEIEYFKTMMKNTKGRGISNPNDKQKQSKSEANMSDDENDGRGYVSL